ncbi:MAG: methylenetetrahydrofolate reductase [NAD(P)H] [Verrucomicrobia bacterium]|nr:methylenetetrahydrofolate reductase [NAD(P)H] [Verrucomicrobiota bacterium]MCH8512493.1 methylenetetrahydrofolate reductase [NAD(P)H] [Kiritimatiellia bacterium]
MNPKSSLTEPSISELLRKAERPLLSYEFFPPKSEAGLLSLQNAVEGLRHTQPDFVTVTYGAGGSTQKLTFEVAELLRRFHYQPVMPHLTCVGSSRDELEALADRIHGDGFRNIMTLRGDPPKGETQFVPPPDGLSCARDLVKLLKSRHPDFCLGVAGYPEVHPEAISPQAEMDYLKEKVDAGAEFITTQMFMENSHFYAFMDRCEKAGIHVPVLPGIMPALSLGQIRRILGMCGSVLPPELENRLIAAGDDAEKAMQTGILWSMEQIVDLLQNGVPGIHLYVLNQIRPAMAYQLAQTFIEMTRG